MKTDYMQPFIDASTMVINQVTGFTVSNGEIYEKEKPYLSDHIIVLIGMTGQISGNVVIAFEKETAFALASAMMMGMPVNELDEMASSALGELCNMILGNAVTLLSQKDIVIDITPPGILTGDNMKLSIHKSNIISVPLNLNDGHKLEIDISYEI